MQIPALAIHSLGGGKGYAIVPKGRSIVREHVKKYARSRAWRPCRVRVPARVIMIKWWYKMVGNYLTVDIVKRIEEQYGIKIYYCDEMVDHARAGHNEIYLGKYSSPKIEILCLFHELGHIIADRIKSNNYWICTLSQECVAWEICIELIHKHRDWFDCKFNLDYDSEELTFMRKCLKSYFNSEYNDLIN